MQVLPRHENKNSTPFKLSFLAVKSVHVTNLTLVITISKMEEKIACEQAHLCITCSSDEAQSYLRGKNLGPESGDLAR